MDTEYKNSKTLEARKKESSTMLQRFPDRVPVIVQRRKQSIQDIDKKKFMTPKSLTFGQFVFVVRKRLQLRSTEAIFLFTNNKMINSQETMFTTYEKEKDEDGFLYIIYDFENPFG